MGRRAARLTHLALCLVGLVLFAVFVIPRWWVLMGDIPATLATVGRIVAGFPIAAAAVPVALSLQRSLKDGATVPELALRLRAWSGVLHIVAGVLIVLTAVAEIWLTSPKAAPWLYAVYGAAAAIAVLAVLAFVLSFVAEKPPAPPKPAKATKVKPTKDKKEKKQRRRGTAKAEVADDAGSDAAERDSADTEAEVTDTDDDTAEDEAADETVDVEAEGGQDTEDVAVDETVLADETAVAAEALEEADAPVDDSAEGSGTDVDEASDIEPAEATSGLKNKRPTGKRRHRLRR